VFLTRLVPGHDSAPWVGSLRVSFLPSVRRRLPQSKRGLEFPTTVGNILARSIPTRKCILALTPRSIIKKTPGWVLFYYAPRVETEPYSIKTCKVILAYSTSLKRRNLSTSKSDKSDTFLWY